MSELKSAELCYAAWSSAWGPMGAVWGPEGIVKVLLPHYSPSDLDAVLRWENPAAAKDEKPFARLVELSRAYFNGQKVDFTEVACSLPQPSTLTGKVLAACRKIPYGQTRSYGSIAQEIGAPDASRAVAAALGKNPVPLVVPCHRVVYSDGRSGGFSSPGGVELKLRMLAIEKRSNP
jgi:methylated-DNA-[protein]-cysteine S-methyltransferase